MCKLEVTKFLIKMNYFFQINGKPLNCNTHYSFKLLLITVVWEWLYLKFVVPNRNVTVVCLSFAMKD